MSTMVSSSTERNHAYVICLTSSFPNYELLAFVVKYTGDEKSNHLPLHTDESTHSFVIALNEEYKGGGTYFSDHDMVARLRKGEILSFRGDSMLHGGEALTSGNRLIVAVFLYHDEDGKATRTDAKKRPHKRPAAPETGDSHMSKEAKTSFSFNFQIVR